MIKEARIKLLMTMNASQLAYAYRVACEDDENCDTHEKAHANRVIVNLIDALGHYLHPHDWPVEED